MKHLSIIFALIIFTSCQTARQWNKKGLERGWIDTATVTVYDTIKIKGSSKDTLFYGSVDTIFFKDKNFTTTYFRDSITHKIYLKTVVNNRDTTVIREVHTTTVKSPQYSFTDHLKAVWYVWLGLFVLLIVIALIALFKK